jgi:hypothetical protein
MIRLFAYMYAIWLPLMYMYASRPAAVRSGHGGAAVGAETPPGGRVMEWRRGSPFGEMTGNYGLTLPVMLAAGIAAGLPSG